MIILLVDKELRISYWNVPEGFNSTMVRKPKPKLVDREVDYTCYHWVPTVKWDIAKDGMRVQLFEEK